MATTGRSSVSPRSGSGMRARASTLSTLIAGIPIRTTRRRRNLFPGCRGDGQSLAQPADRRGQLDALADGDQIVLRAGKEAARGTLARPQPAEDERRDVVP